MPERSAPTLSSRCRKLERKKENLVPDYTPEVWTKEEDALLLDLHGKGVPAEEINRRLNRDARVVWRRNVKINPNYQRKLQYWTSGEDGIVWSMRSKGKDWREIAMVLGPNRTHLAVKNRHYRLTEKRAVPLVEKRTVESPSSSPSFQGISARHAGGQQVRNFSSIAPGFVLNQFKNRRFFPHSLSPASAHARGIIARPANRPQFRTFSSAASELVLDPPRIRRWAPHEIELLVSLRQQKIPVSQIAKELGRTVNSVESRCRRPEQQLPAKRWKQSEIDALFAMHRRGDAVEKIARELNRSVRNVQTRLKALPLIPKPAKKWSIEELIKLKELELRGVPIETIASEMQRSIHSVNYRLRNPSYKSYPKPKPWSQQDEQLLAEMHARRVPQAEIALRLQRTVKSVENRIHMTNSANAVNGDVCRKKGGTPFSRDEDEKLKVLCSSGHTW